MEQPHASNLTHEDAEKPIDPAPASKANQPVPHVGRPLDGSQYIDVAEEQIYAEHPEQQKPGLPSD